MKTILNLKQYVILLVTAFAMASCLGSNDPDFTVGGIGYVIQTVREIPGEAEATTISSQFTPVIYTVANEPMTKCSVKAPGGESILMTQMESFGGYYWLSNLSYNSSMDKLPSGTFTITAYNQDEEPAQGTAVINNTTEMKTKLKELSSRRSCQSIRPSLEKIKVFMRGWLNYYGIADMKNRIDELNSWLYHRIRMCIWKQWKLPKTRKRNLIKLGIPEYFAHL